MSTLAVALLLLLSSVVQAAPLLTFDNPTVDGGTVTYNGLGGPAVADDVIFQQVIGVGTPANSGVQLFCYPVNCLMDFTTGANLLEGPPVYHFAGGGSLDLIGGLNTAADGSGAQIAPAGTLLAHDSDFRTPAVVLSGGVDSLLFVGVGADLKEVALTDFYGLPAGTPFVFANTVLSLNNVTFDAEGGFTATVNDADFANAAVPESGTLVLLGTGIIGLGVVIRRKATQQ